MAESIEFIEIVKKELPKIKTPCLIVHSKKDHTIKPDSAQLINDQIGSEQKKLVWLENSAHIISVDNDKEFVFKEVLDFFNENKN